MEEDEEEGDEVVVNVGGGEGKEFEEEDFEVGEQFEGQGAKNCY